MVRNGISISAVQPRSWRLHARQPDAVPRAALRDAEAEAGIAATAAAGGRHQQAVAHRARRVDLEEVAAALVEVRIERPHEAIVAGERAVAHHLVAEQAIGIGIEAVDAEVETIAIEGDADFGALGGRRAVLGLELCKVGGRDGALPDRFLETPIDVDALAVVKPDGGDARRGGIELLCNGLFGRQQQREYEPEPRFHRAGLYRLRVADLDRGRGDRGAAGEQGTGDQEIRRSGGRGHEAYGLSRRVIDSAARPA